MGQNPMKISRWKTKCAISYVFCLKSILIKSTGFITDISQYSATLIPTYMEYLSRTSI